ncbi:hypothetical protein Tco_0991415 [Tanacetum coccineum]|uniref:No apical meristem-associated C-terminal domain-containing protein n=1 Tax=Tanacetum coccineum TaxID=301880 RepID=A0ABQ5EZ64_9ASTR
MHMGLESGSKDTDYVQRAMIHYEIDTRLPFKLRHCWEILKQHPKWQEIAIPNFNTGSEGDKVQEIQRPEGRDQQRKPVMVNNQAKGSEHSKPKEQGEASTSQAGKSGVNSPPKKDVDNVPLKNTFDALKDTYASNDVGSIMDDSDTEEVENVFVEDNGTPMDNLVDDARKKVEAPPR